MPVIPKPVLKMRVLCSTMTGSFTNVLYYECATPPTTVAILKPIIAAADAAFAPLYKAVLSGVASYQGIRGEYLGTTSMLQADSFTNGGLGILAGGGVSDQNAVVIRRETGLSGRSNSGRWFVGGMDASSFAVADPDQVSGANIAAYQALASALCADQTFATSLCHARHWNRKTNTLVVIASGAVSSRVASRDDRRRHSLDYPV
jgi:hypothetical protein